MIDANHGVEDSYQLIVLCRFAEPRSEELGEQGVRAGVPRYGKRLDKVGPAESHRQVKPLRIEARRDREFLRIVISLPPSLQQQRDNLFPLRVGRIPVLLFLVDTGYEVGAE